VESRDWKKIGSTIEVAKYLINERLHGVQRTLSSLYL
jgi:hypothetical protein